MPAADERCGRHRRPASENLQGRKPREGNVWSCGVLYGDLSAADEAWEWWQARQRSDEALRPVRRQPALSGLVERARLSSQPTLIPIRMHLDSAHVR
jgi:hypothetical protein